MYIYVLLYYVTQNYDLVIFIYKLNENCVKKIQLYFNNETSHI